MSLDTGVPAPPIPATPSLEVAKPREPIAWAQVIRRAALEGVVTLGRIRGASHGRQLVLVLGGSMALAAVLILPTFGARLDAVPVLGLVAITATLLPGAYRRGDQLEAWIGRKLWRED